MQAFNGVLFDVLEPDGLIPCPCDEEWAQHLVSCDVLGFALLYDGRLFFLDECGHYAMCPPGRFIVRFTARGIVAALRRILWWRPWFGQVKPDEDSHFRVLLSDGRMEIVRAACEYSVSENGLRLWRYLHDGGTVDIGVRYYPAYTWDRMDHMRYGVPEETVYGARKKEAAPR